MGLVFYRKARDKPRIEKEELMKKINKPSHAEIKRNSIERKLNRFIENFPYQIAEDLKQRLAALKKGTAKKEDVLKSICEQVDMACGNVELQMNEVKKII